MSGVDLGATPADADGTPQPLASGAYSPGDWGCALWHVWPAATFAGAVNTHSQAPACPVCAYPLWRIQAIDPDGYVYLQGRDPQPLEDPEKNPEENEE